MSSLLGIHVTLAVGEGAPRPAPLAVSEALSQIEVTHKDEGRSGFQLTFDVGRSVLDRGDYPLLAEAGVQPFSRVLLTAYFGLDVVALMDGIVTTHQLAPGDDPGTSKLTVTGEDVSVMMDLQAHDPARDPQEFPNQSDAQIVTTILSRYTSGYGVRPAVTTPDGDRRQTTDEQTPTKPPVTDLAYIRQLAEAYGFVFYVEPGPLPGFNTAYWGEPQRSDAPQPALAVAMGPDTNVSTISFSYDELKPKRIAFPTPDGPIELVDTPSRTALSAQRPVARSIEYFAARGLTAAEARVQAQSKIDASYDAVATAQGTLDALRYGRILRPRGVVDVRGAGERHDGSYYVSQVTHTIDVREGAYQQSFSLRRDGVGARSRVVAT